MFSFLKFFFFEIFFHRAHVFCCRVYNRIGALQYFLKGHCIKRSIVTCCIFQLILYIHVNVIDLKCYYNYFTIISKHIGQITGFGSGEDKCTTIVHCTQRARSSPHTTVLVLISHAQVVFMSWAVDLASWAKRAISSCI